MGFWERLTQSLVGRPPFDARLRRETRLVPLDEARVPTDDDARGWAIFHDWLEERGDVRAELLRRYERDERFDDFITANAKGLLGELAPFLTRRHNQAWRTELGLLWRRGLPRGLSFRMAVEGRSMWPWVERAWNNPFFDTVDWLGVGLASLEPLMDALAERALAHPGAQRVRTLVLGDFTFPDECMLNWAEVGEVSLVWRCLPRLEHLSLQGDAALGDIAAPALRSFSMVTVSCGEASLEACRRARWPRLEHFTLWTGETSVDAVVRTLEALPASVVSLGLCNSAFTGELVEALTRVKLAQRLTRLDLSKGTLDDDGARRLLEQRAAFPKLTQLDLSENYLSPAAVGEFSKWVPCLAEGQRDPAEFGGERFIAVGE